MDRKQGAAQNQSFETYLEGKSREGNETVLNLIHNLSSAVVYPEQTNTETNKKLWDAYAREWNTESDWVRDIAGERVNEMNIEILGDEWSRKADLERVVDEFIKPYVNDQSVVAEIGSGGGRVSRLVCPLVKQLNCFDISSEMLNVLRTNLTDQKNVQYNLLEDSKFSASCYEKFDFLFAFDVFVHLDLHTIWRYLQEIRKLLKPHGKAFVSTANLLSPEGWKRFEKQKKYSVGGFYFMSPDMVLQLIEKSDLQVVKTAPQPGTTSNLYFNRDYLVVVERKQ